jgi:hypothetical protein
MAKNPPLSGGFSAMGDHQHCWQLVDNMRDVMTLSKLCGDLQQA